MGFSSESGFRSSFLKKLFGWGFLSWRNLCHHAMQILGLLQTWLGSSWPPAWLGVPGLPQGPAPGVGRWVARWPLSLSPFVLFILGSPGGPGAHSAYRSPPPLHLHFNAPQVAGCCSSEGGGGPGAPSSPLTRTRVDHA